MPSLFLLKYSSACFSAALHSSSFCTDSETSPVISCAFALLFGGRPAARDNIDHAAVSFDERPERCCRVVLPWHLIAFIFRLTYSLTFVSTLSFEIRSQVSVPRLQRFHQGGQVLLARLNQLPRPIHFRLANRLKRRISFSQSLGKALKRRSIASASSWCLVACSRYSFAFIRLQAATGRQYDQAGQQSPPTPEPEA